MWIFWEQIRRVAHSHLINGMTMALWILLGTCFVRTQCVRVYFACTKRLFILLKDATLNVPNACLRGRWGIGPLKNKQTRFSWSLIEGFKFLKRQKICMKMILQMCIVQHALMRNVFSFQPTKLLVFSTLKSAIPALTFWIFFSRTKNWKLCCLVVIVQIDFQKTRVTTMKKEIPF